MERILAEGDKMTRDRCYECEGKFGEPYIIAELFGKKIEGSIRERDDPEIDFCHACLLKLEAPKECKYCYTDRDMVRE